MTDIGYLASLKEPGHFVARPAALQAWGANPSALLALGWADREAVQQGVFLAHDSIQLATPEAGELAITSAKGTLTIEASDYESLAQALVKLGVLDSYVLARRS